MALVYMTGFEVQNGLSFYGTEGWTLTTTTGLGTATGRFGGKCCNISIGASSAAADISHLFDRAVSGTTITIGFALFTGGSGNLLTNNTQFFQIRSGTGQVGVIRFVNSGGRVVQMLNAAQNLGVNSTTILAEGTWYYIEAKWVYSATVGSMTLRINGVQEGTLTGINTGTTVPNGIRILTAGTGSGQSLQTALDDIYVCDGSGSVNNDFLGEQRIDIIAPTGAGNTTGLTPNTGSNWAAVDEAVANGDTDYVAASASGLHDTYVASDVPAGASQVAGVKSILYARKDEQAARQIAPVIRKSGTDHVGTTTGGLTTAYLHYTQLYDQDPASAPWSVATVNAMEIGVKVVT